MQTEIAGGELRGASIPAWAIDVLATPGEKRRLKAAPEGIVASDGATITVEQSIIDLSGHSADKLQRHSGTFTASDPRAVEFLTPYQLHFRRLLKRFAGDLAPGAIVADIASADAEFVGYFPTRRVLAMDLSVARLRRAIDLGRVDFAVLADIRNPPLVDGSVDAIVSSHTLHHLPQESIPRIVAGLARCLKPGGRLAATLASTAVPSVIDAIGADRVIRQVRIGGPVSQWWERVFNSPSKRLARRLGRQASRAAKPLLDCVSSLATVTDRLARPVPNAEGDWYWVVIQAK
jgi:SAM-dependent methyltransferase